MSVHNAGFIGLGSLRKHVGLYAEVYMMIDIWEDFMELTISNEFSFNDAADMVKQADANEKITIYVKSGIYREKVSLVHDNITLIGESPENTILENADYGYYMAPGAAEKLGTFNSFTLFVDGDNFCMKNLSVKNSAGYGEKIGQGIALYLDSDNAHIEDCALVGRQDTLFTAPLPEHTIEPRGFKGPKENAPRKIQKQYYKNCYIEGDVDFVFGGATAYFDSCEIKSLKRDGVKEGQPQGYVTAPSTPESVKVGYVFDNCRFTSDCPANSVYLGRPWRDYARVTIKNSYLGAHIIKEGWHDWGKERTHDTTDFREEGNYGPGAELKGRVKWINK